MSDAIRSMDVVLVGLWIALFVAIGVLVLAGLAVVGRFVSTRLERRYLPEVARWSRRRASLSEDAGPWACPACSSVNAPAVLRCYRCDTVRPSDATELAPAASDPSVFHRPEPRNRFDPGLYRGPGGPTAPAAVAPAAPAPVRADGDLATHEPVAPVAVAPAAKGPPAAAPAAPGPARVAPAVPNPGRVAPAAPSEADRATPPRPAAPDGPEVEAP